MRSLFLFISAYTCFCTCIFQCIILLCLFHNQQVSIYSVFISCTNGRCPKNHNINLFYFKNKTSSKLFLPKNNYEKRNALNGMHLRIKIPYLGSQHMDIKSYIVFCSKYTGSKNSSQLLFKNILI